MVKNLYQPTQEAPQSLADITGGLWPSARGTDSSPTLCGGVRVFVAGALYKGVTRVSGRLPEKWGFQ